MVESTGLPGMIDGISLAIRRRSRTMDVAPIADSIYYCDDLGAKPTHERGS
jgi:hypothetical protein